MEEDEKWRKMKSGGGRKVEDGKWRRMKSGGR